MEWITTTVLISQLTGGDTVAWQSLVQRFRPPIIAISSRARLSHDAAEDVVQESLLALIASLKDGSYSREKGRLSSWLYGIARMKVLQALDVARRRKLEPLAENDDSTADVMIDEKSLLDSWEGSWSQMVLLQSLQRVRTEVDPKTYSAFEGVALGGESVADAAARLGITLNAVAVAKHRVLARLKKLREELETV